MKKRPIEKPEPPKVEEPKPYELWKSGIFSDYLEPIFNVLESAITPIIEKYEFDAMFLGGKVEKSYIDILDGYCNLYGKAGCCEYEGEKHLLNGEGGFSIFLHTDVDVNGAEVSEEIFNEIKDVRISYNGKALPLHFGTPFQGMYMKDANGRWYTSVEVCFTFGESVYLKPCFVEVTEPTPSLEETREAVLLWERWG